MLRILKDLVVVTSYFVCKSKNMVGLILKRDLGLYFAMKWITFFLENLMNLRLNLT